MIFSQKFVYFVPKSSSISGLHVTFISAHTPHFKTKESGLKHTRKF